MRSLSLSLYFLPKLDGRTVGKQRLGLLHNYMNKVVAGIN